jgi:ligand-binding SRPBCC domain-containing protein
MIWNPVRTLSRRQWVPRTLHETFEFFERPQNLARITPPWLGFRILTPEPIRMVRGLTLDYTVRVLGVRSHWRSLISEYDPPASFRDVQLIGPYRRWDHRHRF